MASITSSIPSMPCGPPKPRKAVLETVCVLQRCERICGVVEVIGIVGMKHGAVGDGATEIGGKSGARRMHEIHAADAARLVEADLPVDDEIMALAGHDHVVIAVEAELGRRGPF